MGRAQCVQADDRSLEDVWQHAYKQRKQEWKKHTVEQAQGVVPNKSVISAESSIIDDGQSFCKAMQSSSAGNHNVLILVHDPVRATEPAAAVDISVMIAEYELNTEQARAFSLIVNHSVQDSSNPLHMFLGGTGGTGKSRVVTAVEEFFKRRNEGHCFHLVSYMGVAARNISGMTFTFNPSAQSVEIKGK